MNRVLTRPSRVAMLWLAVAAIAVTWATHAIILSLGLRFDDYMMLRPFARADYAQVLAGNWGPVGGFQDAYYRPITGLYHGLLFTLFGLHAWPLHLVSLIELAVVVWLLAIYLWTDHGPRAAVVGLLIFATHPVLPDAASAWVLNQMHLLALLVVMSTLLLWQQRRHDPRPSTWWPIVLLAVLGSLIKEDTAMVLPAALALQWGRARVLGDVPPPSRGLLITTVVTFMVLAGVRVWLYPHLDVFELTTPRSWRAVALLAAYGPVRSAALGFQYGELSVAGSVIVIALQVWGARRAWVRASSTEGWLWLQGLILMMCVAPPLAFAYDVKSTRLHLTVLAGVLMWTGGALAALSWRPPTRRWRQGVVVLLLVGGLAQLAWMQRVAVRERFAPCSDEDLWFDNDTSAWPVIVPDIKQWFAIKADACAAQRYQPMHEAMDVIRWPLANRLVMLATPDATSIAFALGGTDVGEGTQARITIDGRPYDVPLSAGVETRVTYPLVDSARVTVRGGHRIDVWLDHAGARSLPTLRDLIITRATGAR